MDAVAQIDNPRDEPNGYCSGLLGIKVSNQTLQLLQSWEVRIAWKWEKGQIKNE